jgi:hypothetical protein
MSDRNQREWRAPGSTRRRGVFSTHRLAPYANAEFLAAINLDGVR